MPTDIARLDLHIRRRLTIGYAAGIAAYMLVIVALYPAFKHSSELDKFASGNSTVAALFGVSGSLTSPAGWINANAYTNFFPLIILLLTIGYGAAAIAGQDDDGTLGLIVALPRARRAIVGQKIAAMTAMALLLSLVVAVCVLVGRMFDVDLDVGNVVTASLAVMLLGIDLGLVALAIGAATGSRGSGLGIASAIAAASYLVSSLAPVVGWVRPLRFGSLFYWAVGDNQLAGGAGIASFGVLVGVGVAVALLAVAAFDRLDVH